MRSVRTGSSGNDGLSAQRQRGEGPEESQRRFQARHGHRVAIVANAASCMAMLRGIATRTAVTSSFRRCSAAPKREGDCCHCRRPVPPLKLVWAEQPSGSEESAVQVRACACACCQRPVLHGATVIGA